MNALNTLYRLFPTPPVASVPVTRASAARLLPTATPVAIEVAEAMRPDRYRRRDFGTGYGRSSGYAQDRSYANDSSHRLVRVG
ncbi:hypothetical protein GCM10011521_07650 [Arenimonas soli]|uniref:Uncharacterized protein n=1 Tax=Arenimonas soli TaxID=2269504 RepID=A0ABQ1HEF1_9GAMM|nr:hypothetical protein [Arenimonas soli]GGA71963.1 hypothetical protein GCM10011521_07650 [Arenimonas soli]